MAATKNIVLVTGANGGIGFEVAAQLISDATKHVLLGSRSADKGNAAIEDLQSRGLPGGVELLQVDVTSEDSIAAAAKKVESEHGRLDTLVNNAAIGVRSGSLKEKMALSFETNSIGPALMVESFAPLLKEAHGTPRIINVSSGAASVAMRLDPKTPRTGMQYPASKAALSMVTACQTIEYSEHGFKVFCICPGFCVSNLGPYNTAEMGAKPAAEGAAPIVGAVNGERDAENGRFLNATGQYPW